MKLTNSHGRPVRIELPPSNPDDRSDMQAEHEKLARVEAR